MKIEMLGVKIDDLNFSDALERALFLARGDKHYLVTPNPEFVVSAQRNERFRKIINLADLSIPDGIGILWAGRRMGKPFPERVAGVDLAEALVSKASQGGLTTFFLGGWGDTAERAAKRLKDRYKGLNVVGSLEGSPNESSDAEVRRRIGQDRIDLLLVAYGHPKQELWIERNLRHLNVGLALGIGGAFDFWSGQVPRAPAPLRAIGLEWLYRLLVQPWRWRRQLTTLPVFIWLVLKSRPEKVKRPLEAGAESSQKENFKV